MQHKIGCPRYFARLQPAGYETVAALIDQDLFDQELVGLRGGCRKSERNLAEAELEQPISAARLAVIVPLGGCPSENLDLTVVQPEAPVDRRDLWLDRAVIWEHNSRRTALDDGRGARRHVRVRERLGGENNRGILLAKRLQP